MTRRIVEIAVCVAALAACSALAWWQWQRFAAGGSFQNLGYVLQWPLFGLFPAFVVWRLRRLKRQADQARRTGGQEPSDSGDDADGERSWSPVRRPAGARAGAGGDNRATARPAEDADDELAAYNRYLAELNARDRQTRPR
jgi:hypothetical protein